MRLSIHWNGLPPDAETAGHLERRLGFALARFGDEIADIRARLADLNGPRGGVDKEVKLLVTGRRIATRIVVAADSSMIAAIDCATERMGLAVARSLDRYNGRFGRIP